MKIKKLAAISLSAAFLAVSLTGCTNYKELLETDQERYIELAFENTAKEIAKRNKTSAFNDFIKAANGETFEISASGDDFDYTAKISAKDNFKAFQDLKIGDKAFTVNTSSDKENVNFSIKSDHTDGTYYVGLNDISSKLDSSVFAPSSGSKYALSEDNFNSIKECVENYANDIQNSSSEKILTDNLIVSTETKDVSVGDETAPADVITYTLTDDVIDKLISDYCSQIGFGEIFGTDYDEYLSEYLDSLTNEGTVNFYISTKNHCLMLIDGSFTSSEKSDEAYESNTDIKFSVNFGKDIAKADCITLNVSLVSSYITDGEQFDSNASLDMVFHDIEESDTDVSAKTDITASDDDSSDFYSLNVLFDKSESKLTASLTDSESVTKDLFSATLQSLSDRANVIINEINYYDSDNTKYNLLDEINLQFSATNEVLPDITGGKEFLTLSESEMDTFTENLSEDINEIL